ncbi:MAG TPA: hypothetical protein VEK56_07240, partial [Vicinamibacterales bacterium]|nr:hypothetical protein [Vicinamibacterales bacterium]
MKIPWRWRENEPSRADEPVARSLSRTQPERERLRVGMDCGEAARQQPRGIAESEADAGPRDCDESLSVVGTEIGLFRKRRLFLAKGLPREPKPKGEQALRVRSLSESNDLLRFGRRQSPSKLRNVAEPSEKHPLVL